MHKRAVRNKCVTTVSIISNWCGKFQCSPWRWRQWKHLKHKSLLLTPLIGQDNFTSGQF